MTPIIVALVSFAVALVLGWVLSKAYFRAYTIGDLVGRKKHEKMRERYRKRLLIMHKLVKRHEATQGQIKEMLMQIQAVRDGRTDSAEGGNFIAASDTQGQLSGLLNSIEEQDQELIDLQAQVEPIDLPLSSDMERASDLESELHLIRIERDELFAKLWRLESEPKSASDRAAADSDAVELANSLRAELGAVRAELSSRERQVQEIQRKLDNSEAQRQELRAALDSWKQRVNPLTQKLKQQRSVIRDLRDNIIEAE